MEYFDVVLERNEILRHLLIEHFQLILAPREQRLPVLLMETLF